MKSDWKPLPQRRKLHMTINVWPLPQRVNSHFIFYLPSLRYPAELTCVPLTRPWASFGHANQRPAEGAEKTHHAVMLSHGGNMPRCCTVEHKTCCCCPGQVLFFKGRLASKTVKRREKIRVRCRRELMNGIQFVQHVSTNGTNCEGTNIPMSIDWQSRPLTKHWLKCLRTITLP